MSMPASPLLICLAVVPSACGWYHNVQAPWLTVNAGVYVAPAAMTFCGPPSTDGGTCSPCQCTVVSSPRLLVTSIRTSSPLLTLMVGPRYAPLNPAVVLVSP